MPATIEWSKLLEVVWVSLIAGIGITTLFSLVIYGGTQATELRRAGSTGAWVVHGVLAVVAFAAFAAGVAYGVSIILNKS